MTSVNAINMLVNSAGGLVGCLTALWISQKFMSKELRELKTELRDEMKDLREIVIDAAVISEKVSNLREQLRSLNEASIVQQKELSAVWRSIEGMRGLARSADIDRLDE